MAKHEDFVSRGKRYIEAIKENERRKGRLALRKASHDILEIMEKDINEMFRDSVSDFYGGYTPVPGGYERRNGGEGSMYDLLRTERKSSASVPSLIITLDESRMGGYRSGYKGEDGLFTTVFIEGWHGGARQDEYTGKKFWRKPIPDPDSSYPGYYYWGSVAEREDVSPSESFRRKVMSAAEGEWTQKYHALIRKYREALR